MGEEYRDEVFEDYERFLKEHQAGIEKLMDLEHVPRYIRLMEIKSHMRKLQESIIAIDANANFLDRTYQKTLGKPY